MRRLCSCWLCISACVVASVFNFVCFPSPLPIHAGVLLLYTRAVPKPHASILFSFGSSGLSCQIADQGPCIQTGRQTQLSRPKGLTNRVSQAFGAGEQVKVSAAACIQTGHRPVWLFLSTHAMVGLVHVQAAGAKPCMAHADHRSHDLQGPCAAALDSSRKRYPPSGRRCFSGV